MENPNEPIKIKDYTIPKYESIGYLYDNRALVSIKDDLLGNLYGYIDVAGNEVIPCQYTEANDFSEGVAFVINKNGNKLIINQSGNKVLNCDKYTFKQYNVHFSNGLLRVIGHNGYGFIDKSGKEVIPCCYTIAEDFCEGMALVGIDCMDFMGYFFINQNNCKLELSSNYNLIPGKSYFNNGIAPIYNTTLKKYEYINKDGKPLSENLDELKFLHQKIIHGLSIAPSVKEKLVIYCADINFGGKKFTLKALTKKELSDKKIESLSLIKSKTELEIGRILDTEKSINPNSIGNIKHLK